MQTGLFVLLWMLKPLPKCLPFNPLHTVNLFHCYMLDKSISHFRGAGSLLLLFSIFDRKSCLTANTLETNQMPHYVASGPALFDYDPFTGLQVRMG